MQACFTQPPMDVPAILLEKRRYFQHPMRRCPSTQPSTTASTAKPLKQDQGFTELQMNEEEHRGCEGFIARRGQSLASFYIQCPPDSTTPQSLVTLVSGITRTPSL